LLGLKRLVSGYFYVLVYLRVNIFFLTFKTQFQNVFFAVMH